jgi:hypothetical protein
VVIKCSEIDMQAGEGAGAENFNLLCAAIANADEIIVDGKYELTVKNSFTIDKNIRFIGNGKDCGFTISDASASGIVFTIGENCF